MADWICARCYTRSPRGTKRCPGCDGEEVMSVDSPRGRQLVVHAPPSSTPATTAAPGTPEYAVQMKAANRATLIGVAWIVGLLGSLGGLGYCGYRASMSGDVAVAGSNAKYIPGADFQPTGVEASRLELAKSITHELEVHGYSVTAEDFGYTTLQLHGPSCSQGLIAAIVGDLGRDRLSGMGFKRIACRTEKNEASFNL